MIRVITLASLVLTFAIVARAADAPAVKLTQEAASIKIEIGGQPFTTYYFADGRGKPYLRPFFYPVLASDGTPVTSDQSVPLPGEKADHPHHRSMWVSQGAVNGVDHWANAGAKQRHVGFQKVQGDAIVQDLIWEDKAGGAMLKETRTFRFFGYPDGSRGVDFTLVFEPAGEPVTFGDTKEAGLCSLRMVKAICDTGTITQSTGATGEKNTWGKPAAWCDISGQVKGKTYGAAVLDHPGNPRHPSPWHVRQYGLLSANIFGLHDFDKSKPAGAGDFKMTRGTPVTFKYRVVIHTGDAKSAGLDAKFKDFAEGK